MLLTRGNTAVRCRHLVDSKNICTPVLRAGVLVLSTVFATRCQGFAVSSSGRVSHEYAKLWDCQAAKSWRRAELVQQSLTHCYCGDLSVYWKYTWFVFIPSPQSLTNGMKKFCYLLYSCCDLALFIAFLIQYIMRNSFANRSPQGLDCA